MDSMSIPTAMLAVVGGALVALIAGFFSYLGMVSSKENKVSEFRLSWINGLRDEVASYTAALKSIIDVAERRKLIEEGPPEIKFDEKQELEWFAKSELSYRTAIESLAKIELRLNHEHACIKGTDEHRLMKAAKKARSLFNEGNYDDAFARCDKVTAAAARLLKKNWDLVRDGESEYRRTRAIADQTIRHGVKLISVSVGLALLFWLLSMALNFLSAPSAVHKLDHRPHVSAPVVLVNQISNAMVPADRAAQPIVVIELLSHGESSPRRRASTSEQHQSRSRDVNAAPKPKQHARGKPSDPPSSTGSSEKRAVSEGTDVEAVAGGAIVHPCKSTG